MEVKVEVGELNGDSVESARHEDKKRKIEFEDVDDEDADVDVEFVTDKPLRKKLKYGPPGEMWSCKFNSGMFRVDW